MSKPSGLWRRVPFAFLLLTPWFRFEVGRHGIHWGLTPSLRRRWIEQTPFWQAPPTETEAEKARQMRIRAAEIEAAYLAGELTL